MFSGKSFNVSNDILEASALDSIVRNLIAAVLAHTNMQIIKSKVLSPHLNVVTRLQTVSLIIQSLSWNTECTIQWIVVVNMINCMLQVVFLKIRTYWLQRHRKDVSWKYIPISKLQLRYRNHIDQNTVEHMLM